MKLKLETKTNRLRLWIHHLTLQKPKNKTFTIRNRPAKNSSCEREHRVLINLAATTQPHDAHQADQDIRVDTGHLLHHGVRVVARHGQAAAPCLRLGDEGFRESVKNVQEGRGDRVYVGWEVGACVERLGVSTAHLQIDGSGR